MENVDMIKNEAAEIAEDIVKNEAKLDMKSAVMGAGVTLGATLLWKFVVKPIIRKVKNRKPEVNDEEPKNKTDEEIDFENMDLGEVPEI